MPDTEFIKYKLPDQPKPPTGIAINAPLEKLDHDLYRPAAQSKLCEVSNTCAGLKDDNPTDNNNYDSKMLELNQNLDDLKGNQQKLEKELHGLTTQNDDMTDISEKIRDEQKVKKDNDNSIHEKIRDEQKVKKDDDNSIPKEKPYRYAQDLEIIIDSHGNGLLASKLYRNIQSKIKVLGPGKKNNIKGAGETILETTNKDTRHIVLGVRKQNDLKYQKTINSMCK
ncbi:unnamed protein product [Mytilus coruscus]|uniref:Uncharacterized protein n=1 Tax=Mytilus coruscus TaxID=42192 RepID=A0A6J8BV90_MYTCO|nr:unnamed protein product [Mytilus coruscus]